MSFERVYVAGRGDVPEPDRRIGLTGGENRAVRRPGEAEHVATVTPQDGVRRGLGPFPDPHDVVGGAGREIARRRPGAAEEALGVTAERPQLDPRLDIPPVHQLVAGRRRDRLTVRRPGDAVDAVAWPTKDGLG